MVFEYICAAKRDLERQIPIYPSTMHIFVRTKVIAKGQAVYFFFIFRIIYLQRLSAINERIKLEEARVRQLPEKKFR